MLVFLGLLAVVAAVLTRGSASATLRSRSCERCNVLLITIDTLRLDRVGAFGSTRQLTPTLDALASDGVRWTRAYASAPLTLPSHASILTAVSPPVHGLRTNGLFRLGPDIPTIATVLKGAGYRTGGFVGAFVLDARFGLGRGFDVYDDRFGDQPASEGAEGAERRAEEVTRPALEWIVGARGLGLGARASGTGDLGTGDWGTGARGFGVGAAVGSGSLIEARGSALGTTGSKVSFRGDGSIPVAPGRQSLALSPQPSALSPQPSVASPEPSALSPQPSGASPQSASGGPWFAWIHLYDPHEPYRAPEPYASQHEPYDAEIAYVDATIGKLLGDLRAAGRLDRTLIVVAADHGESLGEHGERTHGVFVYDATMRVPVIFSGSRFGVRRSRFSFFGSGSGSSVDGLTRLIDLAPTLLDVIGVAAPASFEGRSVVGAGAATSAYVEAMDANLTRNWAPLSGIVTGRDKLIDLPIAELYDLPADPHETTNLFAREPERARTLQALLRSQTSAFAGRGGAGGERTALSADARQRLQALGYVAASADAPARVYTDADDPKRLIGVSNELNAAIASFNRGDRAGGLNAARAIVAAHPSFATAYGELASMQHASGDLAGAITTLDGAARRGVADPRSLVMLAGYEAEAGRLDRAAAVADAVAAAHPDFLDAYMIRGVVAMRRGDHQRAQELFRHIIALDPSSASAWANLAADDLSSRNLPAAIDALQHAVALAPHNFDALYNLAMALDAAGRRDEARAAVERFVQTAPRSRYAREIDELRALMAR
jgi:arylsulfatase A-like enzyme/Tfp pilus assembly protein PilF